MCNTMNMNRHQRLFVRKITKKVKAILPIIFFIVAYAVVGTMEYNTLIK